MISRYGIFCKVIETGSFTKTADIIGYSQSAVSQTIKSLEQELSTTLVNRGKDGITLTRDGEQYFPYLHSIYSAELNLNRKHSEMQGLKNSTIRIGTFITVSRFLLPEPMMEFKKKYPEVKFELQQGSYDSIERGILDGNIDFGFVNPDAVTKLETRPLVRQRLQAVLPKNHPLANEKEVTLAQLAQGPIILPDEGEYNLLLRAFQQEQLTPNIEYKVYDDYSIISMVEQGLGISAFYDILLAKVKPNLEIREIRERPERTLSLAWHNWDTMPLAARKFIDYIGNSIISS